MAMTRRIGSQAHGESPVRRRADRQGGNVLLGFLVGLIVGLSIAVVVALFVTRAPVPFVNKANRASELSGARSGQPTPDPNAVLNSRARETVPGDPATPTAAPGSMLPPQATISPMPAPASLPEPSLAPAAPAAAPADSASYVLQAGSFRASDDAEGMKARLALLGYEARVIAADVNGQTMYRVRIGPFAQQEDANRARSRLASGGVESSVMRQR